MNHTHSNKSRKNLTLYSNLCWFKGIRFYCKGCKFCCKSYKCSQINETTSCWKWNLFEIIFNYHCKQCLFKTLSDVLGITFITKLNIEVPKYPLSKFNLIKYANNIIIAHFWGVYMGNNLPENEPYKKETAIINLDDTNSLGTHWVCYK